MSLNAAVLLAAFATLQPRVYAANPERVALVAVAVEQQAIQSSSKWRWGTQQLAAAIATAILKESSIWESVHSGEQRGKAGEICLMQIHPKNRVWERIGIESFESMGGVDPRSTRNCIAAGTATLVYAANRCYSKNYHRNWAPAMWTQYHYGSKCWLSPHAHGRARMMRQIATTRWVVTPEIEQQIAAARAAFSSYVD